MGAPSSLSLSPSPSLSQTLNTHMRTHTHAQQLSLCQVWKSTWMQDLLPSERISRLRLADVGNEKAEQFSTDTGRE